MTVISFGTSAPELIVSIKAAVGHHPEIAIGNVIGSNIANIALVLGITILIFPIAVDRNSKVVDWPVMMGASLLFFLFAYDNIITFWEGLILFLILCVFTFLLLRNSMKKTKKEAALPEDPPKLRTKREKNTSPKKQNIWLSIGFLALGFVGLYFGAQFLLSGAVTIATSLGMTEKVIAVTIVAFGTSVPELVTSGIAAFRKQTDISVGNLIGSNIFNIMAVIGITAMVEPIEVGNDTINFDLIWVLGISAVLLPMMIIGRKMGRLKGFLLFGTYIAYIVILLVTMNEPAH